LWLLLALSVKARKCCLRGSVLLNAVAQCKAVLAQWELRGGPAPKDPQLLIRPPPSHLPPAARLCSV